MAPRNFQQTQPITTTLRTILGLYAPSSCLRELVQNADDAGASEVEFVLDSSTYIGGPLLHNDLHGYQGPALLARNNSCFTETDFRSLSSVGDSIKQHDITTTGKFGLGFNSVFHWTDLPSVLSGDALLFLDPHHTWSKEIGQPGGPAWNIVEDNPEEMRNHLAAFTKCQKIDPGQPFGQTMIRIPLRTPAQALASKIKSQASTVTEIKEALEDFCQEILGGGLLFLKNVRSVGIKVDEEFLIRASFGQNDSRDTNLRDQLPGDFVTLYGSTKRVVHSMRRSFKTRILYESRDSVHVEEYLIQSLMASPDVKPSLDIWSRTRKLFPWVTIAAPLTNKINSFPPSLFSTLRLPIQNHHPVHIHGLFAISQDRKSICLEERDESTEWNRWLSTIVAECYTEFLQNLATFKGEGSFRFWPKIIAPENANTLSGFVSKFFWERVILKETRIFPLRDYDVSSICSIKPLSDLQYVSLDDIKTRNICASVADAYFNFLSNDASEVLAPLLRKLELPVVRPPSEIWPLLRKESANIQLKQLDSLHLSRLFKAEANCGLLEEFLRDIEADEEKSKVYATLFNILAEECSKDQSALHQLAGCRVLERYRTPAWTARIANEKFDAEVSESSPSQHAPTVLEVAALYDHEVYKVADAKQARFLTPRQFETMPCIVQPKDARVATICSALSELMIMDPTCLPSSLVSEQGNQSEEFARLLGALEKVEISTGSSAKVFLESALQDLPRDPLLILLKAFLQGFETAQDVPHLSLIKALPIWRRLDRPKHHELSRFLPAEDADFCRYSELFVPWANNVHSFVEPSLVLEHECSLRKLGIRLWTPSEVWSRIKDHQPKSLHDDQAVSSLNKMLQCLDAHKVQCFSDLESVALDGTRRFCSARHLYDDQEPIFKAAFRQEADKRHLHPEIRKLRSFGRSIGLRMSSSMNLEISEQDYLECATAVDRTQSFDKEAEIVGSYIEYERSGFHTWQTATWTQLSRLRLFPVFREVSDMPMYRQPRMSQLAGGHDYCCLQDVAQTKDLAITWSQKKRLKKPPSSGIFTLLPDQGRPAISVVYEHLQFLVGICRDVRQHEISTYVGDIKACYKFLQENVEASSSLPGIQDSRLWLNVDEVEHSPTQRQELVENFLPAKLIYLNRRNGGLDSLPNIQVAKKLLLPYVVLLEAIGCQKECLLVPTTISLRDSNPVEKILRTIDHMREESEFTEVIFEAQGQRIPAHKVFLTAVSEKWHAQFSGVWSDYGRRDVIPVEMDFKTLSILVKHAYSGIFEGSQVDDGMTNDQIVSIVDETLDILAAADEFMMPMLHDQVEFYLIRNVRPLMHFNTVEAIMERASSANAPRLREVCDSFLQRNLGIMEKYRKQDVEEDEGERPE